MMNNLFSKRNIIIAVVLVAVVAVIAGIWWYESQPGPFDDFAQCLKDREVKFYGAFWCPHCQAQKKLFEKSQKKLPYIECSTPDGNNQLEVCQKADIQVYPTWEFPDGSRQEGELTFQQLANKSSCLAPK